MSLTKSKRKINKTIKNNKTLSVWIDKTELPFTQKDYGSNFLVMDEVETYNRAGEKNEPISVAQSTTYEPHTFPERCIDGTYYTAESIQCHTDGKGDRWFRLDHAPSTDISKIVIYPYYNMPKGTMIRIVANAPKTRKAALKQTLWSLPFTAKFKTKKTIKFNPKTWTKGQYS
jgi:hypothetical protein